MATAEETTDVNKVFFCHLCLKEVAPTEDITCSICDSGAIEEMLANTGNAVENDETADAFTNSFHDIFRRGGRRVPSYNLRHNAAQNTRRQPRSQVLVHIGGSGPNPFHFSSSSPGGSTEMDSFIQQLFGTIGVQLMRNGFSSGAGGGGGGEFGFNGSLGDYAWGPNGLDNIITQLLNQLDNTGPPPADKGKIQSLPLYEITQKELDERADCAVCQDLFTLGEEVKQLPCQHNFHQPCIDPWLELHDSCPICRCNLNGERSRDDS